MKVYAFFSGLSNEGIEDTISEYTSIAHAGWSVHTVGYNPDGFWVLLERTHGQ